MVVYNSKRYWIGFKKSSTNWWNFFFIRYYFFPVRSTRSGEAIQIDEYAPTRVPNMSARVKPLILSGPKKNIATRTITIVNVVKSERRIVSQIEASIRSENDPLLDFGCWRLDLIRSITTIVSLIEYPRTVSIAVMKNVSILNSGKKWEVTT